MYDVPLASVIAAVNYSDARVLVEQSCPQQSALMVLRQNLKQTKTDLKKKKFAVASDSAVAGCRIFTTFIFCFAVVI